MQRTKERKNVAGQIPDSFLPLHAFLWFHGIGFSENFRKSGILKLISFTMTIFVDIQILYDVIKKIFFTHNEDSHLSKIAYTVAVMHLCSLILRFWLYTRRNQMNVIVKKIVKVYKLLSCKKFSIEHTLLFSLVVNDLFALLNLCIYIYGKIMNIHVLQEEISNYFFECIPTSYGIWLYFAMMVIMEFCLHNIPPLICIYFFFVTRILKKLLKRYEDMLSSCKESDFDHYLFLHNKITEIIITVMKFLQTPLLLSFLYLLGCAFYSIFTLLLTQVSNSFQTWFHILRFFWSVFYFSLLCQSSSSIITAAVNIKNLIHELPTDDNDIAKLSLVLKVHRDFVGIKMLDSIVINKSLVLEVFGMMLIYGLIFSTFNITKHLDI